MLVKEGCNKVSEKLETEMFKNKRRERQNEGKYKTLKEEINKLCCLYHSNKLINSGRLNEGERENLYRNTMEQQERKGARWEDKTR